MATDVVVFDRRFAALLGVEDQSLRRWENLVRVPKQADHGIRLVFRDLTPRGTTPLADMVRQIDTAESSEHDTVRYRFRPHAKQRWEPQGRCRERIGGRGLL
jgi:hypothetical protein